MCVATDDRQITPDRWLPPLVVQIKTGSEGEIKGMRQWTEWKPGPPFHIYFLYLQVKHKEYLHFIILARRIKVRIKIKEGQHTQELGGGKNNAIQYKEKKFSIKWKVVCLPNQHFLQTGFFAKSSTPIYNWTNGIFWRQKFFPSKFSLKAHKEEAA